MGCPVVHFEIGCRDKARTEEFFRTLFGWTMTPAGPASMIDTGAGSGINGHITELGHEPYHYANFYVQVDDIPAYLARAESLGGKTLVPPSRFRRGPSHGSPTRMAPRSGCGRRSDPGRTSAGDWGAKTGMCEKILSMIEYISILHSPTLALAAH